MKNFFQNRVNQLLMISLLAIGIHIYIVRDAIALYLFGTGRTGSMAEIIYWFALPHFLTFPLVPLFILIYLKSRDLGFLLVATVMSIFAAAAALFVMPMTVIAAITTPWAYKLAKAEVDRKKQGMQQDFTI